MGIGWTPLRSEQIDSLTSSNGTVQIPKESWLPFLERVPGALEMWACAYDDLMDVTSDGTTISGARGHVDTIRHDSTHSQYKAYRYLLCLRDDGSAWFVGPFKDLDYGHWFSDLPAWRNG